MVEYHFGQDNSIRPYLGLGAGVYYTIQRFDIGLASLKEDGFRFGLAPEVGVLIPLYFGSRILLGARYDHAFTSGETLGSEFDLSFLSAKIGFVYAY